MSAQPVPVHLYSKREQRGWYSYDWGNSAFSTTVVTLFLGPYLTSLAKAAAAAEGGSIHPLGIAVDPRAYWGYLISLSVVLQALMMPVIGALADYGRRKKELLALCAYTGASATEDWTRITVPASQCPRIRADFLERERALGEEYFAQEYNCEFIEDGRCLFSDADLQRLFKTDIKPIDLNRNDPAWNCVMKPVKSRFPGAPTEWPNIYARDE